MYDDVYVLFSDQHGFLYSGNLFLLLTGTAYFFLRFPDEPVYDEKGNCEAGKAAV